MTEHAALRRTARARVRRRPAVGARARFVDDLHLPGMLHAAVVRSHVARRTLTHFDSSGTDATVFGPDDFGHLNRCRSSGPSATNGRSKRWSSTGTSATSGNLGLVVASSRAEAEGALDHIIVEIDERPASSAQPRRWPRRSAALSRSGHQPTDHIRVRRRPGSSRVRHDGRRPCPADRDRHPRLYGSPIETRGIVVDPPRSA